MAPSRPKPRSRRATDDAQDAEVKSEMDIDSDASLTKTQSPATNGVNSPAVKVSRSPSKLAASPLPQSPAVKQEPKAEEEEDVVGGDITVKMEPGSAPKLARTTSKKVAHRPPPLFNDEPNATKEAVSTFEQIKDCIYSNKLFGITDHALECDCSEEWDSNTNTNDACGEDSDCINRATKMECISDCSCGTTCQNMRFQRKQYADVTVFKTAKKGFGLRADRDMRANEFVFEYIGEVIGEGTFHRRMAQYDREGIKHFYFMSLNKGEFVDATKKGNLGRFCNHSCNPNCYVDKWVVGDRLRMGIFTERAITAGEELVFNYNVDRYGADPQPCYCGEPNCTGFIGGKTQTERATKLSAQTIEALGIEDADDWDLAVAKKNRKKKTEEDDEEYVDRVQPKNLEVDAVTKVMATLAQCKEKWIVVKLLDRIQRADDERVMHRVVRMHGYRIFKTVLSNFMEDANICLQVFSILERLPRLTRNKIQDSGIEDMVEKLTDNEDEKVAELAKSMLSIWAALEVGYRIPRMKRDPAEAATNDRQERDEFQESRRRERERQQRSPSPEIPKGPAAPTGPRGGAASRGAGFFKRPNQRNFKTPLPAGWFEAQANGKTYYYNATGQTTWQRPTAANKTAPATPKVATEEQKLQELLNSMTKSASTPQTQTPTTSTPADAGKTDAEISTEPRLDDEKWRSYSEEKQKKIYENTLFPHIQYVMNKFKQKLPREDLKRFAKQISKQMVESDFKRGRVDNPHEIPDKQQRKIKLHCKDFFDKAVAKRREHEKKVAEKDRQKSKTNIPSKTPPGSPSAAALALLPKRDDDDDVELTDNEIEDEDDSTTESKRKREADETPLTGTSPDDAVSTPVKRMRIDTPPPPPPPPPPPAESAQDADMTDSPSATPADDTGSADMELDVVNGEDTELPTRSHPSS